MLKTFRYNIPFKHPFKTGSGTFEKRAGLLICFEENNHFFWGEAAPLPGFSTEVTDDAENVLQEKRNTIHEFTSGPFHLDDLTQFVNETTHLPSLQFALSYLGLSLLSYRNNCTINELFGIEPTPQIFVNDIIGHNQSESWFSEIRKSIHNGFTSIKIKALYPLDTLTRRLYDVCRNESNITFRLDANRSWPIDKLPEIRHLIKDLPVEYIEEPYWNESEELFINYHSDFDFPVALDETVHQQERLRIHLQNPEQIIIIKPTLIGNVCDWVGTIKTYRSTFENVIITTALESAIGRTAVADIAGLIGCRNRSHGLNTGKLFQDDLLQITNIKNGRLILPIEHLWHISPGHLNSEYIRLSGSSYA